MTDNLHTDKYTVNFDHISLSSSSNEKFFRQKKICTGNQNNIFCSVTLLFPPPKILYSGADRK